jgi:hypothetical protein
MTSELRPHIVYLASSKAGAVEMFPTYAEAFSYWYRHHTYQEPYLIATVGRVIDPSQAIVDVNE